MPSVQTFAIEVWAYLTDWRGDFDLILRLTPHLTLKRNINTVEGRNSQSLTKFSMSVDKGVWFYLCFTVSGTTARFYKSASRIFTGDWSTSAANMDRLYLGRDDANTSSFNGFYKELRI